MPVIHFKPEKVINLQDQGDYNCPMYKTSARRGVLSTTGNFSFNDYYFKDHSKLQIIESSIQWKSLDTLTGLDTMRDLIY